jgi:PAS domain S-box-containing protein
VVRARINELIPGSPSQLAMLGAGPGRVRAKENQHPFVRGPSKREVRLFQAAFVCAFVGVPIFVDVSWPPYFAAAGLSIALTLLIVLAPWDRWPPLLRILPPIMGIGTVALLRVAGGGTTTGISALMLLGVVWVALYDGRRALAITIGAMALALAIPLIVVGSPDYPPIEWRRAAVLIGIAIIIGASIQALVRRVRQRGEEAARGREFLLAVMNSAAEGIVSIDAQGRVEYANPSSCALLGYDLEDLRGAQFHDLVHHTRADGTAYPEQECPIHETMTGGDAQAVDDDLFWRSDGTSFPVSYTSSRIDSRPESDEEDRDDEDARWRETGVVITFTDISERRRIEQIKDELVSVVSHELRTPLTSIRGSLGLIAGGAVGEIPAEAERMIGIAVTNTDRLVRLINEILDLERIESGRVELTRRLCDSGELMEHAAATMAAQAEAEGTRIDVQPFRVPLWADPDRITQTLINLLSNAVKFSPAGEPVLLRAARSGNDVRFDVVDHGRGIPADQLESVFERFGQVDASDSRQKGGTGLGLPIARSIVHQHGGRMWAESTPGEGTTMSFTLPAVASSRTSPDDHDGLLALVIEDDPDIAQVLEALLSTDEMHVWTAPNATEAVRLLGIRRPDLIVLDLSLPDADGRELVGWMRGQPELVNVPLAIYTVKDLTEADREQLQLGPSLHATKGVTDPDEFARLALGLVSARKHATYAREPVA